MSAIEGEPHIAVIETLQPAMRVAPGRFAYCGWRRHAKRALDLLVVGLLSPLWIVSFVAIGVFVKLRSPGPVLFRHERVGQGGTTFSMFKFRTMSVDSDACLHADPELYARYVSNDFKLTVAEDPRIAPGGRFLRAWSLDELPQLLNVLTGRMSLVGPRPIVAAELSCYGSKTYAYLDARPGITGRWQTAGRNHVRYPDRAQLDAQYLDNWTLSADVVILLRTIPAVIRRIGAH